MNLFYQPSIPDGVHELDADESRHATRALRRRRGDIIHVTDGKGSLYTCRIVDDDQVRCRFEVVATVREPTPGYAIHVAISPLSLPDRLEWFVEKAVEFGVASISFILCERTEKRQIKLERLQKIAIGAMKQSLRCSAPLLVGPIKFDAFVKSCQADQKFIAKIEAEAPPHLYTAAVRNNVYAICIGPEGDFSDDESACATDQHFVKVSLGSYRLRSETAGIAAVHALNLVNLS